MRAIQLQRASQLASKPATRQQEEGGVCRLGSLSAEPLVRERRLAWNSECAQAVREGCARLSRGAFPRFQVHSGERCP